MLVVQEVLFRDSNRVASLRAKDFMVADILGDCLHAERT
jgi:hypothetical protein